TGGDVDDRVATLFDRPQKLLVNRRVRAGKSVAWITRVQMDDRGARFGRRNRLRGNLLRRDGQMRRHTGSVRRAGNRTGNDDLSSSSHVKPPHIRVTTPAMAASMDCSSTSTIRSISL